MKKRNSNSWNRLGRWLVGAMFVAAFAASVFLLSGCGDLSVAPPALDRDNEGLNYFNEALGGLPSAGAGPAAMMPAAEVSRDKDTSEVNIDDGGTVAVDLSGDTARFDVPKGAVNDTVMITIDAIQVETPFGEITVFEFGPEGLVFNLPAQLTLDSDRLEGESVDLYWWDPNTLKWEYQASTIVTDGQVKFEISHFSKYGIS